MLQKEIGQHRSADGQVRTEEKRPRGGSQQVSNISLLARKMTAYLLQHSHRTLKRSAISGARGEQGRNDGSH
jgi:hypothetical protein